MLEMEFLGKNKQTFQKWCGIACSFVWLQCGQRSGSSLCCDACCSGRRFRAVGPAVGGTGAAGVG